MARQALYKYDYLSQLLTNIQEGVSIEQYKTGDFNNDSEYIKLIPNVDTPIDLQNKLLEIENRLNLDRWKKDLEEAKCVYESFKNLTRLQATDERLWAYLTHVSLFKFLQLRWPIPWDQPKEKIKKHIIDHWFLLNPNYIIRHSIGGLWWSVYTTYDEDRENPYELTEYYYQLTTEFGIRRLGMSSFTDNKNAMIGILEYMKENAQRIYDKHFRSVVVTQYFNYLGGVKCLACLDKDFFKKEMEKLDKIALNFNSRNEVQSNKYLLKGLQ